MAAPETAAAAAGNGRLGAGNGIRPTPQRLGRGCFPSGSAGNQILHSTLAEDVVQGAEYLSSELTTTGRT